MEESAGELPVIVGQDHAALALLPISLALRQPQEKVEPVQFTEWAEVDGRPQRLSVTLIPGAGQSLPVHGDQLVYLALLQLALRNNPPQDRLYFRRLEAFEVLGWPNRGWSYDRLREALDRLTALTVKFNSALIARNGREYSRQDRALHLIDAYHIGDGQNAECFIDWGLISREAFVLGDFKRLDWGLIHELGNPIRIELYRLLDRVTLAGQSRWQIGWKPLAARLGMDAGAYHRPARFKQILAPHLDTLIEHRLLERWEYARGGLFVFHVNNYLRGELRRVLVDLGVYENAINQLIAGHDEWRVMAAADCVAHGAWRVEQRGAFLVQAIREGYELRYPQDEPEAFLGMWGLFEEADRRAYHQAGIHILGATDDLFAASPAPDAWPLELRAVVRFLISHGIDPTRIDRSEPARLVAGDR